MQSIAILGQGLNSGSFGSAFDLEPAWDERNCVNDILLQRSNHFRHSFAYFSGLVFSPTPGMKLYERCPNQRYTSKCNNKDWWPQNFWTFLDKPRLFIIFSTDSNLYLNKDLHQVRDFEVLYLPIWSSFVTGWYA